MMTQLMSSVLVSAGILAVSLVIVKSAKMQESDKMKSIILLLVFFSMVTIVKEYKRQPLKQVSDHKVVTTLQL